MQRSSVKIVILTLALIGVALDAGAGTVVFPGGVYGDTFTVGKVTSLKEARFLETIHQQFDFSCGSAALATLLTYHYQDAVTEQEVFLWMYNHGDQAKIHKEGFSLLDMKHYLEANGYHADGFYVSLDQLADAGVPAIVLINIKGYNHFVVVKGITDKRVLVGDPSVGSRIIPRGEFEKMWKSRLVFIIRNKNILTQNNFNRMDEWRHVSGKAPIGLALRDSALANITMLLPGPGGLGP